MKNRLRSCLAADYADNLDGVKEAGLDPAGYNAEAFAEKLLEAGLGTQAINFIARILNSQELVWWCCRCLAIVGGDSGAEKKALKVSMDWLRYHIAPPFPPESSVSEDNSKTPAVWLEHAVAYAANPPGENELAALKKLGIPDLATVTSAGCVSMASLFDKGNLLGNKDVELRQKRFLNIALDIVSGKDNWVA